ncbi:MAG: hypothetical protein EA351_00605 [Gemmatimonadales bacterium]|nr:MAG: hypothetical protein EA351_00605 [Gemmatimonadales bacterium]
MRDATSAQLAAYGNAHRRERERVLIADATDTLVDVTPWVRSWTVEVDKEAQSRTCTVVLQRETPAGSLAPLMEAFPGVDIERRIEVATATVGVTDEIGVSDWVTHFVGFIDDVDWGGESPVLTGPCRDAWGVFHDEWVEAPFTVQEQRLEESIQDVLDTALGVGAPTLVTVGDPDFQALEYQQQVQRLEDALGALRDLIGWDLRYKWSEADGAFLLTFYEPPTYEDPLHTFGPDDYWGVEDIGLYTSERRRVCIIEWAPGEFVTVEDSDLEPGDRRKPILIDASTDPQINSAGRALALGQAVIRDTAQPPIHQTVSLRHFPWVELYDRFAFLADGVHYSTTQERIVARYSHGRAGFGEPIATQMGLRFRPAGSAGRWYRRSERDRLRRELRDDDEILTPLPPIEVGDVALFYTETEGPGFSEESDRESSLGGFISTTRIGTGLGNLFRAVTQEEASDGITLYVIIAVANTSEDVPWPAVRAWVEQPTVEGVEIAIGADPAGIVDLESSTAQGQTIADDETAPGGGVTFSAPEVVHEGVVIGHMAPETCRLVHVRLDVEPGAEPQITDGRICFGTCFPRDAEPTPTPTGS